METSKDILSESVHYQAINYNKASMSDAFIAGAKWYRENLQHSASHPPAKNTLCLVYATIITEDIVCQGCFMASYINGKWISPNYPIKKSINVIKYIYASDLLI